MILRFYKLDSRERGVVLPLFVMTLGAVVALTALVVNAGFSLLDKRMLKDAAEAGALAGAVELHSYHRATFIRSKARVRRVVNRMFPILDKSRNINRPIEIHIGRYQDGHFSRLDDASTTLKAGVAPAVWANAVKVTLSRPRINFFGTWDFLNETASAVAIGDAPESRCVGPFVVPVCGLVYGDDDTNRPKGHKEGDYNFHMAAYQEIILGQLPNPNPYPSQTEFKCQPNDDNVRYDLEGDGEKDAPSPLPDFECNITHNPSPNVTEGNLSAGYRGIYPLRGGFGLPESFAGEGNTISASRVNDLLTTTWPGYRDNDGGSGNRDARKGCTFAEIGDRVRILSGNRYYNGRLGDSFTQEANGALVHLINQTKPEFFNERPHPSKKTKRQGCPQDWDTSCQLQWQNLPGASGTETCDCGERVRDVTCNRFDEETLAMPGCTTSGNIFPRNMIEPNENSNGVHPEGRWVVNAMVIAPSNDKDDYCSGTPIDDGDEDSHPVIVGFLPLVVFDTQLFSPAGTCRYTVRNCMRRTRCRSCGTSEEPRRCCTTRCSGSKTGEIDLGGVAGGRSCRGVRAKPIHLKRLIAGGAYERRERASIVQ